MNSNDEPKERYGISAHVDRRARDLFRGVQQNNAAAIGALATLRRAATSEIGDDPAAWRAAFLGFGDRTPDDVPFPTSSEQAVYWSVILYSIHQQGRPESMHNNHSRPGLALGRLAHEPGTDGPSGAVVSRFNALVTADTSKEVHWHLRSLIGQLRANGIPLDYGRLADDLAALNGRCRKGETPGAARRRVQLQWSRDFSRAPKPDVETDSESESV